MDSGIALELAERVQDWHGRGVAYIRELSGKVKAGVVLRCGDDGAEFELTEREALAFRLGLEGVLSCFEKLPFTLGPASEAEGEA